MNIGIDLNKRTATVINGKDRQVTNLSKEDIKPLVASLCESDEMLEALRFCAKNLGTKKILFRDVKVD